MSRKSDLARRIGAVMDAVGETGLLSMPRMVEDVDGITGPGAEQVAKLTLAARSHDWVFSHVVNALQTLETLPSEAWKRPFMVAIPLRESFGKPVFNWDTAPVRRYAGFHDFYHRELEQTFGRWIDLQALWQRRVAGELSDDQAKRQIEARADKAQTVEAKDLANPSRQGQRTNFVDTPKPDVNEVGRPAGNAAASAHRRLRKDAPALHGRVLAGEISPHAAMVQAGFRKRAKSRALTPLAKILKLIPKLSPDDARVVAAKATEKALGHPDTAAGGSAPAVVEDGSGKSVSRTPDPSDQNLNAPE